MVATQSLSGWGCTNYRGSRHGLIIIYHCLQTWLGSILILYYSWILGTAILLVSRHLNAFLSFCHLYMICSVIQWNRVHRRKHYKTKRTSPVILSTQWEHQYHIQTHMSQDLMWQAWYHLHHCNYNYDDLEHKMDSGNYDTAVVHTYSLTEAATTEGSMT